MTRLYKVSVLFQHKLDLSVAECTQLDVVYYPCGQGALGQSGQVLDNVLGLKKDKNRFCVKCTSQCWANLFELFDYSNS